MGDLANVFQAYSKFGNAKSDGKTITLSNSDKWMKEAGVIDGKKITTTNTGIEFKKFKSHTIDFKQFQQYVAALAKSKQMEPKELLDKLAKCTVPGTSGTAKVEKNDAVNRLTDTTKYTGTHKERFDAEGKGKGKEGREDVAKDDGYVQGYKNKDTKK